MRAPRTVDEARALKEFDVSREPLPFGALPMSEDDIAAFIDTDGRAMMVECVRRDGVDEFVKVPL